MSDRNRPEVWTEFFARHEIGDELEATVTSVVRFGAFAELSEGVDGLIHESVMARPLAPGDHVRVRILDIDEARRRISLGPA